jgi:predicted dinucleotide-binding enzyme
MNIAILGTGSVPRAIAPKLLAAGHAVVLGSRDPEAPNLQEWVAGHGGDVHVAGHAEAAAAGELVIDALPGSVALAVLTGLDRDVLAGKVLMDVANAVELTPAGAELLYPNDSLAEELQRALPETSVVKSMNTMTAALIEDPTALPSPTNVFVSGDDAEAKSTVTALLRDLGWPGRSILDLGGIVTARGPEHLFVLLVALMETVGTPRVNVAVVA